MPWPSSTATAAKMVRQTIRAWISWLIDTDSRDHAGTPLKTALTDELAQAVVRSDRSISLP